MRKLMMQGIAFQAELGFFHTRNTAILRSDNREQRLTYTFSDIELPLHFIFSNPIGKFPMRSVLSFGGRVGVNTINHLQTQGISLFAPDKLCGSIQFFVKCFPVFANNRFFQKFVYRHLLLVA